MGNLLGLYDDKHSFQVKDNENKDYGNGYDGNIDNCNNDGGCIDNCRMAGDDKEGSRRRNQQPTIAQVGGGSYIMLSQCYVRWLTPAFLVIPKTTIRKKLESLPPILHPLTWQQFFIV